MAAAPEKILLTRNPEQSGALESGLRDAGYAVDHLPLTQQVLPQDMGQLRAALDQLAAGEFSWLLLTSGNTVRSLIEAGWDGSVPQTTQIGVVGPGTARVLEELTGLTQVWMPAEHSAAGILAELPAPETSDRLLLPQSAQARSQLAQGLAERGWEITWVTAYATVALPHPETDQLSRGDTVLITSSSAAEVWAQLDTPEITVLAIGEPTALTLNQRGRPADAVLVEPTAAGVVDVLRQRYPRRP